MFMLVVFVAILWGVSVFLSTKNATPVSQTTTTPLRTPPSQPSLTPKRTIQAIGSKSFSLLVSYTDQGFEPQAAIVRAGDMVRFTNNSTHGMWITTTGKTCGKGVLDTCKSLPSGEYYEYTFTTTGVSVFTEKSTGAQGSIKVE